MPRPTKDVSTRPVISVDNADQVTELGVLRGHTGPIASVVFSPDGGMLASAGLDDGTVRLWDVQTVVNAARSLIGRTRMYFIVDTLEYLHRGGRIGTAAKLLGSALDFKPMVI